MPDETQTPPPEPEIPEAKAPDLGIPTILPMHFCFRADDSIPQAAQVISPHVRPKILHLWISIQGAIQLTHSLMNACIATPKTPEGIVAFAIPAHLFRAGEEPMLKKVGEKGLVDANGAPV